MCECEYIQNQLNEVLASEISLDEVNANWEKFGLSKQETLNKLKSKRSAKITKLTGELRACKIKTLKAKVMKADTVESLKESFVDLLDII